MREQLEQFLTSLRDEKGYSNNTIVAYRNDLNQFLGFFEQEYALNLWADVNQEQLLAFVDNLRYAHDYASATVARKVAATKSFFRFLMNNGIISDDPTSSLDSPKVRKYLPTAISEEEVNRLLQAPSKQESRRALRDTALLELLYATGMRVSEVVALNVGDVDLNNSSVRCVSKSGRSRERVIPVYPRANRALARYVAEGRPKLLRDDQQQALYLNHRGNRLTRQGLWLIIKKYVEQVGIDGAVTPHTLRHSFATHLLNGGADVHKVQGLLGHANVSTTQVYQQMSDEQVREVYDEAHPGAR